MATRHDSSRPDAPVRRTGGEERWGSPPVSRQLLVAIFAIAGIGTSVALRLTPVSLGVDADVPALVVLAVGGLTLVPSLAWDALHGRFGSDQLAGISIIASLLLQEYLAGAIVVLMLSGGETLEKLVVGRATSALRALANRVPTLAHRRCNGAIDDVAVSSVQVGDELVIRPHEITPVDGDVVEGHGTMDESYLTGEPFKIPKGPGTQVLSGGVNGDAALVIRATRVAADSRYARIMQVMQ
jgi:cation transport ATPase